MNRKTCKECNLEQNEDCFEIKDYQTGRRVNTCKKCNILKKAKYTVEIPSNTKLCSECGCITLKEDFKIGSLKCPNCRLSLSEVDRRNLLKQGLKKCVQCDTIKPLDLFRKKVNKDGSKSEISYCKVCENKKRQIKRTIKRRVLSQASKDYIKLKYHVNKEELKNNPVEYRLKRDLTRCKKFGISLEEYENMRKEQNCKCYLCGLEESKNTYGILVIDHCHTSNKVRKLLCNACNTVLGSLKEDLEYIQKLVDYIKEHQ